jgi:folate-binding protein YgfZ
MTNAEKLQGVEGFVKHDDLRVVEVTGSDARGWLNDLVTGPVGALRAGQATRSLLLTPTGRIRADFTVADVGPLALLQDTAHPHAIDGLLAPYVLSSDVELADASGRFSVWSLPGAERNPELPEGVRAFSPSVLGPGVGLIAERRSAAAVADALAGSLARTEAGAPEEALEEALERWRISLGIPRFGVDFQEGALPAEAGLEGSIDFTKGCFLGQESVAKVRNLGHPPRVLLPLRASAAVAVGDAVLAGETSVGAVTSSAISPDGTLLLALVRWEARNDELTAAGGARLERTERAGSSQT